MTTGIRSARESLLAHPLACGLRSRLEEPWRAYHVWAHPMAMLDHLETAEAEGVVIHDPEACVGFAGWHDSVYDTHSAHGRNEELSALLCEAEMPRWAGPASVRSASAATRATAGHLLPDRRICPDGAINLDVDLSILAADEETFARYERDIRTEYRHIRLSDYQKGRAAILRSFEGRRTIYLTDWARNRWEEKARANLIASIRRLEGTLAA